MEGKEITIDRYTHHISLFIHLSSLQPPTTAKPTGTPPPSFVPTVSILYFLSVWLLLKTLADDTENLGMDYYSGSFALGLSFGRR